jgi:enoyl-CoA hydratase/carnithine racemase
MTISTTHGSNPDYFTSFERVRMTRDEAGVLLVELHDKGKPLVFTARDHEELVDAFYRIGRDRANQAVILTGAGGDWMPSIDFLTFGDLTDPDLLVKLHDEGTQVLENLANIRVPLIWAVEGRAHVHTEYGLLANLIVAGESATFADVAHFASGIVPGDGVYTLWSHHVGPGRAQSILLDPQPISARRAHELGVVSELVADGQAVARARAIAQGFLSKPEATRRFTRAHFVQPIKERLVREVGYGLALESISAVALMKAMRT